MYKNIIFSIFKLFFNNKLNNIKSQAEYSNKQLADNIKKIEFHLNNIKKLANDPELIRIFKKYLKDESN